MVTAAEVAGALGTWTLPELIRRNATEFADLLAITGDAGAKRLSWTWRELADEVLAAAYGLRSVGLGRVTGC